MDKPPPNDSFFDHTKDPRICSGCANPFDRDSPGASALYCKKCQKRIRAENAMKLLAKKAVSEFKSDLAHGSKIINAPHVSEYLEVQLDKFGGINGFASFLYETMTAEDATSKTKLDGCRLIANLIVESTKHRPSAPDVMQMTEKQIRAERAMLLMEEIAKESGGATIDAILEMFSEEGSVIDVEQGTNTATRQRTGAPPEESPVAILPERKPSEIPEKQSDD